MFHANYFRVALDSPRVIAHRTSQALPTSHRHSTRALSPDGTGPHLNQTHDATGVRLVKQHILLDERVLEAATKYHNLSVSVPHGMKLKGKRFVTLHSHGGKKIHLSAEQFDKMLQLWGERRFSQPRTAEAQLSAVATACACDCAPSAIASVLPPHHRHSCTCSSARK